MTKDYKALEKNIIFYSFLAGYLFFLLYQCYELNLWVDETYTLNTTSHNLAGVIQQSYNLESQPPAYFILLSIWRKINPGIFFARLFSVLFIGLAAYFFFLIVKLVTGKEASRWYVIIFLLNPFAVWAALDIRLYAFLLFLSTLAIYYFFRYYLENKSKYLYFYLLTCLIGLYTQYFFAFLIAGLAFSLLVFNGFKTAFKFCLYLLPVLLLLLPNFLFLIPHQITMVQTHKLEYSVLERFLAVFYSIQNVLLGIHMVPFERWIRWVIKAAFFFCILYAYYRFIKKGRRLDNEYFNRLMFIIITISVLFIMLGIFFAVTGIDYQDRYLTIAYPLFILIFTFFKISSFLYRNIIYGALSLYFIALILFNYVYYVTVKTYDYKSVAKYINKIERADEPILFYHSTLSLPFGYYYTEHNRFAPLPHNVIFDTSFVKLIRDTIELKKSIENINTNSKSYLLISDLNEAKEKDNPNRKMFNNYLATHYNTTLDTLYFGHSKTHALRIRRIENSYPE